MHGDIDLWSADERNDRLEKRIAELEGELGAVTKHFEIVCIERDVLREGYEACYQLLGKPEGFNLVDEVTALIEERAANVSLRAALEKVDPVLKAIDSDSHTYIPPVGFYEAQQAIESAMTTPATAEALERVRDLAKAEVLEEICKNAGTDGGLCFRGKLRYGVDNWVELSLLDATLVMEKAAAMRGGQ